MIRRPPRSTHRISSAAQMCIRDRDYRLRADYGLPPDLAVDRMAGAWVIPGPRKVCTKPANRSRNGLRDTRRCPFRADRHSRQIQR
eukprot:9472291-Alexandrium_andersonii.AAC.1